MTTLSHNEGNRPSRLQLDRYATGELGDSERAAIEAWLVDHPEGRAHLAEVEAARAKVRPFDASRIRRSALQVLPEAPAIPTPANRPFPWRVVVGVAVVLAAMLLLVPRLLGDRVDDPESHDIRFRGAGVLTLHVLDGTSLVPWTGDALGEGATVGFRVAPGEHERVVLLSVDGAGTVTVFYPLPGEAPEPLPSGVADVSLPLTVTLDAAPGPEVFVAAFDADPLAVTAAVRAAWQSGGAPAVAEWAKAHDADAVAVEKR